MTCQIRRVNLLTCLTAIRKKTAARTITARYVADYFPVPAKKASDKKAD